MTSVATISNHQSTPVAKATKAEIETHQNDLAYSILVHLGNTLSEGSTISQSLNAPRSTQLRKDMETLKNNAAVQSVYCQTFDENAIVGKVHMAIKELNEMSVNAQDLIMLDVFTDIMEKLLAKPALYLHLFKFNSVKESLFAAEELVTKVAIKKLNESNIIKAETIRRIRNDKQKNPVFYGKPSNECCLLL